MAITITNARYEPKSISTGPTKIQFVEFSAASGATSGTVTASNLKEMYHIILPGIKPHTAAPTFVTNVATLAFTVPAEVAATQVKQGITLTAVTAGAAGNNITLAFSLGGTAGSEVVTVTGTAIDVQIENAVSTRTQVRTAINASTAAAALVTATGTSATAVTGTGATACNGGVDGGAKGTAICIGR